MRAVLQRVKQASVHVDGQLVSSIGPGLLALVGMCNEDTVEQAEALVRKLLALRLWPEQAKVVDGSVSAPAGETRAWRASVTDIGGEVLCAKGTRPDFHQAMGGTTAKPLYESFLEKMRSSYAPDKIQGVFIVLTYNRWRFWSHDGRWPNQRRCVLVALLTQVLLL